MSLIAPAPLGSSNWLLQLRSFAFVGQLATIFIADRVTSAALPLATLVALLAVSGATNLLYAWWLLRKEKVVEKRPDPGHRMATALMVLDLITLTAMLYFSGGVDNPFCFFYFVNLAVGAVMLRPSAAWCLTTISIVCFTVILIVSRPVTGLTVQTVDLVDWSLGLLHLRQLGFLIAFTTCASVITHFVTRTSGQLRQREADLHRNQLQTADAMRLEALTTLAAGAAHELASPLATIDVVCRELTRHLAVIPQPDSVKDDLRLIDAQLEMCRQILARMRSAAGDMAADAWNQTTLGDLIDTTLEGIRDPHRVDVPEAICHRSNASAGSPWETVPLWIPQEAVAQALRNLVHNGLDASGEADRVALQATLADDAVCLKVIDHGTGMPDSVRERAGDPFFTTKEPGRGIGLGLFLARNVITRLGGTLRFQSTPGRGTTAVVILPLVRGSGDRLFSPQVQ